MRARGVSTWLWRRIAACQKAQDSIAELVSITITLRHAIWRVWRDGVFYGDYRSRRLADEAAQELLRSLAAGGRQAKIVAAS